MTEALPLAALAGLLLGALFFGGLWWTVRKGVSAKSPALLFLGSMLLRTGLAVAGFYVVADGDWRRLMACLLGFASARFILVRFAGSPVEPHDCRAEEAGRAP